MRYANVDEYVPLWAIFVERPDGSDFVQNAPLTYRVNNLDPKDSTLAELYPEGYKQDWGPNRRPQSGAVN